MEIPTGRQIVAKPSNKQVIPKLLTERLSSRLTSRIYWGVSLLFNCFLIIISGFFFDAYFYTHKYIINGEDFWRFYSDRGLSNKAVPLNSKLTGMICILTFGFNLMNYFVIGLYILFGGVRDRIKFASKC